MKRAVLMQAKLVKAAVTKALQAVKGARPLSLQSGFEQRMGCLADISRSAQPLSTVFEPSLQFTEGPASCSPGSPLLWKYGVIREWVAGMMAYLAAAERQALRWVQHWALSAILGAQHRPQETGMQAKPDWRACLRRAFAQSSRFVQEYFSSGGSEQECRVSGGCMQHCWHRPSQPQGFLSCEASEAVAVVCVPECNDDKS